MTPATAQTRKDTRSSRCALPQSNVRTLHCTDMFTSPTHLSVPIEIPNPSQQNRSALAWVALQRRATPPGQRRAREDVNVLQMGTQCTAGSEAATGVELRRGGRFSVFDFHKFPERRSKSSVRFTAGSCRMFPRRQQDPSNPPKRST